MERINVYYNEATGEHLAYVDFFHPSQMIIFRGKVPYFSTAFRLAYSYTVTCWTKNANKTEVDCIDEIGREDAQAIGQCQRLVFSVYGSRLLAKLRFMVSDETHPIRRELVGRIIFLSPTMNEDPVAGIEPYRSSFVPKVVNFLKYLRP